MTTIAATAPTLNNPAAMKAVDHAAREFESVFLSEMFSHMFSGLDTNPVFGGGKGEKMFRGMMINQYAKNIAHGPGVGIAAHIQRAMIEMQQKINGGAQ